MAWIGLFVPALHGLCDAAWFSGTLTSAMEYGLWMMKRNHRRGDSRGDTHFVSA